MTKFDDLATKASEYITSSPVRIDDFAEELIPEVAVFVGKKRNRDLPEFRFKSCSDKEYKQFLSDNAAPARFLDSSGITIRIGQPVVAVNLQKISEVLLEKSAYHNFVLNLTLVLVEEAIHLANPELSEEQVHPIDIELTEEFLEYVIPKEVKDKVGPSGSNSHV